MSFTATRASFRLPSTQLRFVATMADSQDLMHSPELIHRRSSSPRSCNQPGFSNPKTPSIERRRRLDGTKHELSRASYPSLKASTCTLDDSNESLKHVVLASPGGQPLHVGVVSQGPAVDESFLRRAVVLNMTEHTAQQDLMLN